MRTQELEQTVSTLTERAEQLETEATELRRENGWLKEIVLLKGRAMTGRLQQSKQPSDAGPSSSARDNAARSREEEEASDGELKEGAETSQSHRGKGKGRADLDER